MQQRLSGDFRWTIAKLLSSLNAAVGTLEPFAAVSSPKCDVIGSHARDKHTYYSNARILKALGPTVNVIEGRETTHVSKITRIKDARPDGGNRARRAIDRNGG